MTEEEVKVFQKFDWYQVDMDRLGKEPHQYDGKSIPFYLCYVEPKPLHEDYLNYNNISYERVPTFNPDKELGFTYTKILLDETGYYSGYEDRTIKVNIPNIKGEIRYVHELQHILRQCGLNSIADNFKIKI